MTQEDLNRSLSRLYRLMAVLGAIGFVWYLRQEGVLTGLAFLLGALGSVGNFWLFNWLSRAISPGEATRKPWQAGAFIGRYFVLFTLGYVIVGALGVNPLPVVFGLFVSTAAILVSVTIELLQNLFRRGRTD